MNYRTALVKMHQDYFNYLVGYGRDMIKDSKVNITGVPRKAIINYLKGRTATIPEEQFMSKMNDVKEYLVGFSPTQAAVILSVFVGNIK